MRDVAIALAILGLAVCIAIGLGASQVYAQTPTPTPIPSPWWNRSTEWYSCIYVVDTATVGWASVEGMNLDTCEPLPFDWVDGAGGAGWVGRELTLAIQGDASNATDRVINAAMVIIPPHLVEQFTIACDLSWFPSSWLESTGLFWQARINNMPAPSLHLSSTQFSYDYRSHRQPAISVFDYGYSWNYYQSSIPWDRGNPFSGSNYSLYPRIHSFVSLPNNASAQMLQGFDCSITGFTAVPGSDYELPSSNINIGPPGPTPTPVATEPGGGSGPPVWSPGAWSTPVRWFDPAPIPVSIDLGSPTAPTCYELLPAFSFGPWTAFGYGIPEVGIPEFEICISEYTPSVKWGGVDYFAWLLPLVALAVFAVLYGMVK